MPITSANGLANCVFLFLREHILKLIGCSFLFSQTAGVWEDLLLAIIGGAWDVHTLLQGVMLSVRGEDDVLAVWSDHQDRTRTLHLRQVLLNILNLPTHTVLKFNTFYTERILERTHSKEKIACFFFVFFVFVCRCC